MTENQSRVPSDRELRRLRRVGRELTVEGRESYEEEPRTRGLALVIRTSGIIILDHTEQAKEDKAKRKTSR